MYFFCLRFEENCLRIVVRISLVGSVADYNDKDKIICLNKQYTLTMHLFTYPILFSLCFKKKPVLVYKICSQIKICKYLQMIPAGISSGHSIVSMRSDSNPQLRTTFFVGLHKVVRLKSPQ